jgi:hypothetical protein
MRPTTADPTAPATATAVAFQAMFPTAEDRLLEEVRQRIAKLKSDLRYLNGKDDRSSRSW